MNCEDVEPLIDLLAAGECDLPTREMVESHLGQCNACAASFAEAVRVQNLLELHLKQDGLERLQRRIEEESKPRRTTPSVYRFVQRFSAAAALVLIVAGLIWWFPRGIQHAEPEFALLVRAGKAQVMVPQKLEKLQVKDAEAMIMMPAIARGGPSFREKLLEAQRNGKLPLPPEVPLEITLVNNGKRSIDVQLGDANAKLTLDGLDKNVIRMPAPNAEVPEPLRAKSVRLSPGEKHVVSIERLITGSPGQLEYVYLAEAGRYSFTPSLQFTADGRPVTVSGASIHVQVHELPEKTPK